MKRIFILAALTLLAAVPAWSSAANVYVTKTGAGTQDGTSLANSFAITALSSGANCGAGAAQIGADTVVHIDVLTAGTGTATFSANGTMFSFQCDGTSGHPIILQFQAGDFWQAPYFSASAAIQITNRSYVIIDLGGATIQDTLNGHTASGSTPAATCPGGPCTTHNISVLIQSLNCNTCEIRNGTLANVYVTVACELGGAGACGVGGDTSQNVIQYGGTNFKAHDLTIHDVTWAMAQNASVGDDNIEIYNINFYNMDHGIACGAGAGVTVGHLRIHDNHFHDTGNFDMGFDNLNHHDGIHCFSALGSGKIQNIYIYNNLFDGNQGQCCFTAWVFLEGGTGGGATPWTDTSGTAFVFNNVFIGNLDLGNGQLSVNAGTGHKIFNNTIMQTGTQTSGGKCFNARGAAGTEAITFKNNVMQGCAQALSFDNNVTLTAWDFNGYSNFTGQGNEQFNWTGHTSGSTTTLAAWRLICSCDASTVGGTGGTLTLSSTGVPLTGSVLIGAGTNLTASCSGDLATLCNDTSAGNSRTPTARPGGATPWDIGAFNYAGLTIKKSAPPATVFN